MAKRIRRETPSRPRPISRRLLEFVLKPCQRIRLEKSNRIIRRKTAGIVYENSLARLWWFIQGLSGKGRVRKINI